MRNIQAELLTAGAFAPYGSVSGAPVLPGAQSVAGAFERDEAADTPVLQLVRVFAVPALPVTVAKVERHPFSAQTFLSLDGAASLIIVCEAGPDGQPDAATLRAFVASAGQLVTYGRGVWHHSLTALQAPATFAMAMAQTGRGDDTVIVPLSEPVQVALPTG